MNDVVLKASGLTKRFGGVTALRDVGFTLRAGQTLGVVGESGSGKSTLGRIITRLQTPDDGRVLLDDIDLFGLNRRQLRQARRRIQLVPQDPRNSLNPSMTVRRNLDFQLRAQRVPRSEWTERCRKALGEVSLDAEYLHAFPRELSGGQAQRVAIARSIINNPSILVCDEAVSALDKAVQAQVLNTLTALQTAHGVAIVFISHDLGVIEHLSDEVIVLKDGLRVESGRVSDVISRPTHPYTRELLASRPTLSLSAARGSSSSQPD